MTAIVSEEHQDENSVEHANMLIVRQKFSIYETNRFLVIETTTRGLYNCVILRQRVSSSL